MRATQLVCWAANIATYKVSPNVGRTLSLKSLHQQSAATGHLIIDNKTNVSVMGLHVGQWWMILARRCEMSGFANDLVKSDIPVCSGKTVVAGGHPEGTTWTSRSSVSSNTTSTGSSQQDKLASTVRVSTILFVAMVVENASQVKTINGTSCNFELDVTDGLLTLPTRVPNTG